MGFFIEDGHKWDAREAQVKKLNLYYNYGGVKRYDGDGFTILHTSHGLPHSGYSDTWWLVKTDGSYEKLAHYGFTGVYGKGDYAEGKVEIDEENKIIKISSGDEEYLFDIKSVKEEE